MIYEIARVLGLPDTRFFCTFTHLVCGCQSSDVLHPLAGRGASIVTFAFAVSFLKQCCFASGSQLLLKRSWTRNLAGNACSGISIEGSRGNHIPLQGLGWNSKGARPRESLNKVYHDYCAAQQVYREMPLNYAELPFEHGERLKGMRRA